MEILTKAHRRKAFRSGAAAVDEWLHQKALSAQAKHGSVTRVLTDGERILGFHTLANTSLAVDLVPPEVHGGNPPRRNPATVTLAWLGVDLSLRKQGIGAALTYHALAVCYRAMQEIPYVAVIVDALTPTSLAFFRQHGFALVPGTEAKLFMSAATLIAAVEPDRAREGGRDGMAGDG